MSDQWRTKDYIHVYMEDCLYLQTAKGVADDWEVDYVETSAKLNANVSKAFYDLLLKIQHRKEEEAKANSGGKDQRSSSKCCCIIF